MIDLEGRDGVIVLSGGNVDLPLLQTMLQPTAATAHGT